jgi:hypothetical protein
MGLSFELYIMKYDDRCLLVTNNNTVFECALFLLNKNAVKREMNYSPSSVSSIMDFRMNSLLVD